MNTFSKIMFLVFSLLIGSNVIAIALNVKKVDRKPESIECSKKADALKLHGKERKKFRADCKKKITGKEQPAPPSEDNPTDVKKPDAKEIETNP